jgi:hypothetical protein
VFWMGVLDGDFLVQCTVPLVLRSAYLAVIHLNVVDIVFQQYDGHVDHDSCPEEKCGRIHSQPSAVIHGLFV